MPQDPPIWMAHLCTQTPFQPICNLPFQQPAYGPDLLFTAAPDIAENNATMNMLVLRDRKQP